MHTKKPVQSGWKIIWQSQLPKVKKEISFGLLTRGEAKELIYRGEEGTRGHMSNLLSIDPLQMSSKFWLSWIKERSVPSYMETLRNFQGLRSLLMVMGDIV